ncbi:hypothetical protein D3Z58_25075 [Clostridiaceae bacterium]|jgi:hypothetical protein|nr:hypothetical protein [Clostridiaceae bacterium]
MDYEELIEQIVEECRKNNLSVSRISKLTKPSKNTTFGESWQEIDSSLLLLIRTLESFGYRLDTKNIQES